MGLITAVAQTTRDSSPGVTGIDSATLPWLGVTDVTGMVVVVTLLYLLAYVNLLEAAEADVTRRWKLASQTIPLAVAFGGIVLYHSLETLEFIG